MLYCIYNKLIMNEATVKSRVQEEYQKGNIIIANIGGIHVTNLKEFIEQPIEGLLYDLNRSEEVILAFIDDPKWVNDFAVCKVIRALKCRIEELESNKEEES